MTVRHSRSGFSLIEVLIAIVVLALGLLGLAAVFPAVVTQQRQTTDAVQGVALANSASQLIGQHRKLNEPSLKVDATGLVAAADLRGWQLLLDSDPNLSGTATGNTVWSRPLFLTAVAGLRYGAWDVAGPSIASPGLSMDANGEVYIRTATSGSNLAQIVHIARTERRFRSNGQWYLWDIAARRVDGGLPVLYNLRGPLARQRLQDDGVQLAVFIRHADAVKTGGPVTITEDANGRPTFDGNGVQYSRVRRVAYSFVTGDFNPATPPVIPVDPTQTLTKIILDTGATTSYAQQINQKLVDQWGVVHTVQDVQRVGGEVVLTISPAVSWKAASDFRQLMGSTRFEMLFTTQVPAAVNVITIHPQAAMGS